MQRKQEEVEGGFAGRLDGGDGLCRKRGGVGWGPLLALWPRRCPCLGAESTVYSLSSHPTLFWVSLRSYNVSGGALVQLTVHLHVHTWRCGFAQCGTASIAGLWPVLEGGGEVLF